MFSPPLKKSIVFLKYALKMDLVKGAWFDLYDSVEYYFESKVGENLDSFEASVGHNYKLSYKVNETYAMSERKENDLLDDIENAYMDFDISKIKKVVVADLTLTAKQGNKSTNRDMNIVMTKENGSWRLLYIE